MTTSPVLSEAPLRERVAEEVRALMARRRITQTALATAVGQSQAAMSRRIVGDVAFDLDDLEKIAPLLGVGVAQLLGMSEGPGPDGRPAFVSRTTDWYADSEPERLAA